MSSTVRWGLLSTARINRRVIPAIRMSRRGEVIAVASRDPNRAAPYAEEWEIPQWFGSYEAMLASDAIDAVYVSVINDRHAEWAVKALRAGKHVLCEKPFALSLADVDAMIATAEEMRLVLAEALMYRHHPQTKIAGQWVREGRLGEITLVRAAFTFPLTNRQSFHLLPEHGGGSLWDVGLYPVSLAQYIMNGLPEWVYGDQWLGVTGVDECFAGQLYYPGARLAQIASAFRGPYYTPVDLVGSGGTLRLNRPFTGMDETRKMVFHPLQGDPEEVPVPEEYLYLGEIEDMHAAILDSAPNYLTLEESRNTIRTILALYESARTGHRVRL